MPQYFNVNSTDEEKNLLAEIGRMRLAGKKVCVMFAEPENHRTAKQNNSLNLWLRQVAKCLNDHNLDVRVVMKEDAEIEWTQEVAKNNLWRPLQKAMTGEESTTKPSTTDYSDIYQTLCRHFAQKHGVTLPAWPNRFGDE